MMFFLAGMKSRYHAESIYANYRVRALVDIGPSGRVGEVRPLPLSSTPIHHFTLTDHESDLDALEAEWSEHPDRARMLVRYTLHYRPGVHSPDALRRRLHALFPRWYAGDLRPVRVGADGTETGESAQPPDLANVEKTATEYLERVLAGDERRPALLGALRNLLGGNTEEKEIVA